MQINPFLFLIFLGSIVFLHSYIRKTRYLLPDNFKELESKYIPGLFRRNIESKWYNQREFNRKYIMKIFPFVLLGCIAVFSFACLLNIETKVFLQFAKYMLISSVIIICITEIYYYMKLYNKYMCIYANSFIESKRLVLRSTFLQCLGFLAEATIVIIILQSR